MVVEANFSDIKPERYREGISRVLNKILSNWLENLFRKVGKSGKSGSQDVIFIAFGFAGGDG